MVSRLKKKAITRRNYAETDEIEDPPLLANAPAQTESLLHSLEQSVGSIGRYVKADRTKYMCFKQKGKISTVSGKPLELVGQLWCLGSSISSTEHDVGIRLTKVWNAIAWFSIM